MADTELDALVGSLPLVEGPAPDVDTIDTVMVAYIDESLKDTNRTLYDRIHQTIHNLYDELDANRNLRLDQTGHLNISLDQFHGVVALSVLRGAAEVILEISRPLRASRELEEQLSIMPD